MSTITTTVAAATAAAATSPSPTNDSRSEGNGSSNSPLLFFVALGFGVVFTNLWIIVGVKYCFRYNQRNRQMRNEEAGDPIDLVNVPRTHRRRREKKLMTMDEVNDKFPLTKYKAWRASRAENGLSTEGGIQPPSSRPASMKNEGGITPEPAAATNADRGETSASPESNAGQAQKPATSPSKETSERRSEDGSGERLRDGSRDRTSDEHSRVLHDDYNDSDDHIQTAIPAELLADPGDSCAICLDTIEDDDDVRGLTCGHAFHASCVDPWLTSRKACCPLCKSDYYIPKPRADGTDGHNSDRGRRNGASTHGLTEPAPTYAGSRLNPFSTRMVIPGRFVTLAPQDNRSRRGRSSRTRDNRTPQHGTPPNDGANGAGTPANSSWRSRFHSLLPTIYLGRDHAQRSAPVPTNSPPQNATTEAPTPRQLESGAR